MKKRPVIVGVMGGSLATDSQKAAAERVGALVADCGAVLLCGGGGGVMEYSAKGASEAGGLTVGVLPGRDKNDAEVRPDGRDAVGRPVHEQLGAAHLGLPHRAGVVEPARVVVRVVEGVVLGWDEDQTGPLAAPEGLVGFDFVLHGKRLGPAARRNRLSSLAANPVPESHVPYRIGIESEVKRSVPPRRTVRRPELPHN